ncbi:hypothetical protein FOA52_006862 [Chlamydomonas sp. UWO 241]|nr:hypothetical protein FOA52_006862 [Chlamydomonas sp. UWO 241]
MAQAQHTAQQMQLASMAQAQHAAQQMQLVQLLRAINAKKLDASVLDAAALASPPPGAGGAGLAPGAPQGSPPGGERVSERAEGAEGDDKPPGNSSGVASDNEGGDAGSEQSSTGMLTPGSEHASAVSGAKWLQPSGPRRQGMGVEKAEQGIISAEQQPTGSVLLRVTLLASGFIIGPGGVSIRDIIRVSGCDISSRNETHGCRPCRVFVMEGNDGSIAEALCIVSAALDRYKELCEGMLKGQAVGGLQRVCGVDFSYQPPPKGIVPFAAALEGHVGGRALCSRRRKTAPRTFVRAEAAQAFVQAPTHVPPSPLSSPGTSGVYGGYDPGGGDGPGGQYYGPPQMALPYGMMGPGVPYGPDPSAPWPTYFPPWGYMTSPQMGPYSAMASTQPAMLSPAGASATSDGGGGGARGCVFGWGGGGARKGGGLGGSGGGGRRAPGGSGGCLSGGGSYVNPG